MSLLQPETFWQRLTSLQDELTGDTTGLNEVDSIAVPIDPPSEELTFTKSSAFFIHHFGLELHGSLAIACKGSFHVLATEKYCILLEALKKNTPPTGPEVVLHRICDDDAVTNKNLASLIETYGGVKVGRLERMQFRGALAASLDKAICSTQVESVDVTSALGVSMSVKDEYALTGFRRAAVITYKVLKHGFVRLVEDVLDQARSITHEQIATHVDECCEDPSKVNIKLPQGHYESCYFPIVQSGGDYDIRPSASTNSKVLSDDVIIVSLGVRYNFHCATMSRTLFIDPVPTIKNNYAILLELQRACLAVMLAGRSLGSVAEHGIGLIRQKYPHLLKFLPKSFGFGLGLDFREPSMILSSKNQRQFAANMVFNLAVGFHDIELANTHKEDAQGSVRNLSKYSMLIADTVIIRANEAPPDVLTKHSVEWKDVSYFINEKNDSENPSDEGKTKRPEKVESAVLNSRLRERVNNSDAERSNSARNEKQAELMRHKIAAKRNENRDSWSQGQSPHNNVAEVNAYDSIREYPGDVPASEIFVDMQAQTLFAPVNGAQVPFHISMVKTVVQPDPDRAATYLRLNFFTPGQALPKDVAPATTKLIEQHGQSSVLIKEMLYRSRESQRLTAAYRMIQELRKRFRQHAAKAAEEADLVPQEKLVKMRDQRIPRMADLTMRPFISGKKTMGTLEAHTNGLRFTSKKHEILDVMFTNIKHSLFQPCENEVMVLIHFNLKNPLLVGKKKTHDVQFFTEVVDASVALDTARRSMYDPDELDEEQRERQLRKKLNEMFKEFCKKMERVAKIHRFHLEFDIPYRDLGFHGVPNREMVLIQPTVRCLVNLTETPFFIVELDDVEHIHFERCTFRSKNFDVIIILKNFEVTPLSINAVPMNELDSIQEWLTDCSITYTAGQASMSWKSVMNLVRSDARFYEETDENDEPKPAGWQFLQADDDDAGGDEDDGDEDYKEDDIDDESDDESDEQEHDDDESDDNDDDDDDDEDDGLHW